MARVLLIEPNRVLARIYSKALEHQGHIIACARSAQQAIDAADEMRPDMVILELQMALHNGIEFLHEFRSYTEWQKVPVVVHTAFTPNALASVEVALKQDFGVKQCLYKPQTSLRQLAAVVHEVTGS